MPATTPSPEPTRRPPAAVTWLRAYGLRVTRSRTAMVELLRRAKTPLTLGDIHAALCAGPPADPAAACDFATAFRFLKLLDEKGLVDKQPWVDGNTRYELKPAACPAGQGSPDHHHHFLVCRQCQRTEKIEDCFVARLQKTVGRQTGYRELTHTLQFSGLCPRCQPPEKVAGKTAARRRRG